MGTKCKQKVSQKQNHTQTDLPAALLGQQKCPFLSPNYKEDFMANSVNNETLMSTKRNCANNYLLQQEK